MRTRAYSILHIKAVDDEKRVIIGTATTPEVDRQGDIVEPRGAEFDLPIPFLWQHNSAQPIGQVTKAKVSKDGIDVEVQLAKTDEPGTLKDRLDEAWQSIKLKLVRGLSIGFQALEFSRMEDGGLRYLRWSWLELSAVTIAANASASITNVKSADSALLAASGRKEARGVVRLSDPGVSGKSSKSKTAKEAGDMKTVAEQIAEWEAKRAARAARMEAIMTKSAEEGRTLEQAEEDEHDTLTAEVKSIDNHLVRLADMQKTIGRTVKAVDGGDPDAGARSRGPSIQVLEQKLDKGIGFARLIKAKGLALIDQRSVDDVMKEYWPNWDFLSRKNVAAGTTTGTNWAKPLYDSATTTLANEFAEFLRPQTIIGKFGTGNIPALRTVPFNVRFSRQTTKGSAAWVGEGLPKPVTEFQMEMVTLGQFKVAGISVITEELLRSSAPSAEQIVRDELAAAVVERIDLDFIDPSNSGTSNVKPASITNGSVTVASGGDALSNIVADVLAVSAPMTQANMPSSSLVWIMNENVARALALSFTTNGVRQFPDITVTGGSFLGYPVIVSQYVPEAVVVLVAANEILLADDGEVSLAVSREASIEMLASGSSQTAVTGTGASLVSMFQTNSVAVRAERYIAWAKRRTAAVAYLTSVNWAGTAGSGDI